MWDIPFRMIPLRSMRPSAIDGIRAEYAIRPVWYGNVLFVLLSCVSALMKLPFCVHINGLGGVVVVVGATIGKVMLRELAWVMCVGAGRNFVSISLGLLVVFTPPI
jgi:hypothetical protein